MKATGIVRRIDDLGRVVIPKEIRRTMRIREGDPLEIFTEKDGEPYLHLHATFCDANMQAHGGHVNELYISATCEMVLRLLPGQVDRRPDYVTGLTLFAF